MDMSKYLCYNSEPIDSIKMNNLISYSGNNPIPKSGTHDKTGAPTRTLSLINIYADPTIGYGYILNFSMNERDPESCAQLFLPYNSGNSTTAGRLMFRSHTDSTLTPWTNWREIIYADEIKGAVNSILKSNGLIT